MEIIEFAGMPKSGKTTTIEIAESYLKREGKKVRIFDGSKSLEDNIEKLLQKLRNLGGNKNGYRR